MSASNKANMLQKNGFEELMISENNLLVPEYENKSDSVFGDFPYRIQHPRFLPGYEWIPKHIDIVGRSTYSFMTVYMSFLFVISTFLNSLVVIATIKNKSIRHPLNYIIVNLAFADLLSGIVAGIIVALANAEGYFYLGQQWCIIEGFMISVFSLAGINSIVVMSVERFTVICKPFGPTKVTKFHAITGVAFTWIYSFGWCLPMLFLPNTISVEGVGTDCAPNWFATGQGPRTFFILFVIFCFVLPLTIIVTCYASVIVTLHKLAKESSLSGSKNPESEVARMVVIMVTAFLVAWLPYAIVTVCVIRNPDLSMGTFAKTAPGFFAKSSLIYNPIIYIGFNRQFRDCVIRMLFRGRNPWQDDANSAHTSTVSQVTTLGTNKVAPA